MQEDKDKRRQESDEPVPTDPVDDDPADEESDDASARKPHGQGGDPDARNVGG